MRKQRENPMKNWLIELKNEIKVVNNAMTAYGGGLKQQIQYVNSKKWNKIY